MKGSDLVYELPLTLKEIATGTQKTISLQHQSGSEKITVKIPKGMITGKNYDCPAREAPVLSAAHPGIFLFRRKYSVTPYMALKTMICI